MAGEVNLPTVDNRLVLTEVPRNNLSAGQIEQPYSMLANAMNKLGDASETVAKSAATQAGLRAVTTDDQGNLQIEKAPIIGPASQDYANAVHMAALVEGEGAARREDIKLREQFRDNPQGYLAAATKFTQTMQEDYTQQGGPALGLALRKAIEPITTYTYRGLLNEKERLDLQRADTSITAGIASARDDAVALARGGDTSSPAFQQAVDKIKTLTEQRVNNPRLAYPRDKADLDLQQLDGDLRANSFLHHIDDIYQNAPNRGEGAQQALKAAETLRTDPNLKLTEAQREQYYHRAVGEIHANEALRRQDIYEARLAFQQLEQSSLLGVQVPPEDVDKVATAFTMAGDQGSAARVYATFARKPLNDDFGRQTIADQTQQLSGLRGAGAGLATSPAELALIKHESGGNPGLVNKFGYAGTYQFGAPLLRDLGVYTPGANENLATWSKTGVQEPGKWTGTFNIPGFPDVKNVNDFLRNPAAQKAVFDQHVGQMNDQINAAGLDRAIGSTINGVPVTREGLQMAVHLGGIQGAVNLVKSGGSINPQDANGTSLLDYVRAGSAAAQPGTPASALWLQVNRAKVLETTARKQFQQVQDDYNKEGIRPSDKVMNDLVSAARATNDHDLLERIGALGDRVAITHAAAATSLPAQAAQIAQLESRGGQGVLSPGQQAVLKDLQRRYTSITTGLKDNPIATTVANFGDRFNAPQPLNLGDDKALADGLRYRGQLAQFAAQNWRTGALPALDKADLAAVQAALDTPDPAVKARIFGAINDNLPEAVRNATLAKLGEKGPQQMVAAVAGSMMRENRDIAESILRGQAAIKADKAYLPDKTDTATYRTDLDKALPPATFSLAGRTDPHGPMAIARGAIEARYADLSAQANDSSGKYNPARLAQAVTDVTGGVLSHNGGSLIAPQRGMTQDQFDGVMAGLNDRDLAGVTSLAGQPISADYLRANAQLESIGAGRYLVRLGRDAAHPIYAYQGANTEMPNKFVLDLRGRGAPQSPYAPVSVSP